MSADTLPSAIAPREELRDAMLNLLAEIEKIPPKANEWRLHNAYDRVLAAITRSQSAPMNTARCACGRTTPHGIVPEENCKAVPCLFAPSSTAFGEDKPRVTSYSWDEKNEIISAVIYWPKHGTQTTVERIASAIGESGRDKTINECVAKLEEQNEALNTMSQRAGYTREGNDLGQRASAVWDAIQVLKRLKSTTDSGAKNG